MNNEANRLLMMFIVDGYKSRTGKISKKTALAMMQYVRSDKELQGLICSSDYKKVLDHCTDDGKQLVSENAIKHLFDNYPEAYEAFYDKL